MPSMNFDTGSSPLSRGILDHYRIASLALGIIPALAGNTPVGWPVRQPKQDHPRSRGEYRVGMVATLNEKGSSPLSRGIPVVDVESHGLPGIIPALAGNTAVESCKVHVSQDHPRSRGEYKQSQRPEKAATGSSPLSRGILSEPVVSDAPVGIIPALAGNTVPVLPVVVVLKDHPRSRGEYAASALFMSCCAGSSPLSRGIPFSATDAIKWPGIIPALAGNTRHAFLASLYIPDHPRSRGEYLTMLCYPVDTIGSSPLSRGIRSRWLCNAAVTGIIPALAGNTPLEQPSARP